MPYPSWETFSPVLLELLPNRRGDDSPDQGCDPAEPATYFQGGWLGIS